MTIPINQSQIAHTTAEWQSLNPTLAADVIGIEVMSNGYNRYKRGDGSTAWLSLAYIDKVYDTDKQDKTDTLTAETTLADDDQFPFYDTSASGHRKTLWGNIKEKLKTYFDSLYAAASHVHDYLPKFGGFVAGLTSTNVNYTFNSSTGSNGIIRANSGSGESSVGFQTAGTQYWTIGKGCGGAGNDFAFWCNTVNANRLIITEAGEVIVPNLVQFGTTSAQNSYAKFIANTNGNYFGLHSNSDEFWIHKQNASNGVIGTPITVDAAGAVSFRPSTSGYATYVNLVSGYMCLEGNNESYCQLGRSTMRWKAVYATQGTIQTSDKRKKTDVSLDIEAIKRVLSKVVPLSFRYNDLANDKTRFGIFAQDFEKLLTEEGLDSADIAALTIDEIDADDVITDGKVYGLSYDQFIPVTLGMIQDLQKETSDLKARVEALESR